MIEKTKGTFSKKLVFGAMLAALMVSMMSVTAFAGAPAPGGITTEMLTPLLDGIVSNVGVILPVAVGIFAIMIGIFVIVPLIRRFVGR